MTYNFHHWPFVAGVFSTPIPFILFILSNLCVLAPLREINQKSLFITIFPFKAFQSISKRFKAIQSFFSSSFFYFYVPSPKGWPPPPLFLRNGRPHTDHHGYGTDRLAPKSFLSLIPRHATLTYGIYSIRPCADRSGRG
jgi:hypothetical protein